MKRTMLITGATGGIGAAIVRAAAARDYRVFATGRDAAALHALPAEPLPLDLRTPGDLAGALPHLDRLDALVHCAGIADVLDFRGLCGCECPCSLDLADFCVGGLGWAGAHKSGGDEGPSQCGEHVGE